MLNMAEKHSLILKRPPRKLEYINKLLQYDQPATLFEKAKNWLVKDQTTRPHSISEWCQVLGSTKNNENTRDFLEELIQKDALVHEDTIGKKPNRKKVYRLDKQRLEQVLYKDPFWNWIRNLSIRIINSQENNRKIVKDF